MKRAILLLVVALPVLAQTPVPGTPVFTIAGSLSCGIRQIAPNQVQMWCYQQQSTNRVLVYNSIAILSPMLPPSSQLLLPSIFGTSSFPEPDGSVSMVSWATFGTQPNGIMYNIVATHCITDPTINTGSCSEQPVQSGSLQ